MYDTGKVAIIDDNKRSRERLSDFITSINFEPVPYDKPIQTLQGLLKDVISNGIKLSICDHRLNERNYANFYGAQVVSDFYKSHIVTVLQTGYEKTDADTTIRPYRRFIPVLLHNTEIKPETIIPNFEIAYREVIENKMPPERQPCRSIIRVIDIVQKGGIELIKVRLIQWDAKQDVGFPSSMLSPKIRESVKPESLIIADVNVDAEKSEDLYFENFRIPDKNVLKSLESTLNNN